MKLILFILLTTSILYSQNYNCIRHFNGAVDSLDNIIWQSNEEINQLTLLTNTKDSILIENNKYYFIKLDTIEISKDSMIIYCRDHLGSKCYIAWYYYPNYIQIYFQYSDQIFGYLIREI